jgi:hypothetical protein
MFVKYVDIKPSASGGDTYEVSADTEVYDDGDFFNELYTDNPESEFYEFGDGDCPVWAEDIRGRIHNEPDRVFAVRNNYPEYGEISDAIYFGLDIVPGWEFTKIKYVEIKPAASGDDMYEASADTKVYTKDYFKDKEILDNIRNDYQCEIFELGVDDCPAWAEDIRGQIYNEPDRVFVRRGNYDVSYFGLDIVPDEEIDVFDSQIAELEDDFDPYAEDD